MAAGSSGQAARCFNLYRPPTIDARRRGEAGPWLDHVHKVYPDDAEHIINWLAHRVQRPQEKINHALVLGGSQGIGKDTLLEPVKRAVGPWNFAEVSPQQMLGRFNGFLKSVDPARQRGARPRRRRPLRLLRPHEGLIAAPPDVLRVDEKNLREYYVLNVCGVIITTNHKTDGIYLPADDRRHFVAWSDLTKDDFDADYWQPPVALVRQRRRCGTSPPTCATSTSAGFDPKAPPPKTAAFWDIVDASRGARGRRAGRRPRPPRQARRR